MSALTTAAILGLAAAGGASVASSAIQAHQAGKAVDAQSAAADKALAAQQQVYQQQQQNAAPYQQLGQSTLGRLGSMAAQPPAQFNPSNYQGGVPRLTPPQPNMPQQGQQGPQGGGSGVLGGLMGAGAALGSGMAAAGQTGQPTDQGQTVTIQTPDGRTLQGFPRARLQEALQRGAKVMA